MSKIKRKALLEIANSAAWLVAATQDQVEGAGVDRLSIEVRDSLAILAAELESAGLMAPYARHVGGFGIWGWTPAELAALPARASCAPFVQMMTPPVCDQRWDWARSFPGEAT